MGSQNVKKTGVGNSEKDSPPQKKPPPQKTQNQANQIKTNKRTKTICLFYFQPKANKSIHIDFMCFSFHPRTT